jgi:hypothetical protein
MNADRVTKRGTVFSRNALAVALALGVAGLSASPAMAAGPAYSKPFVAAAGTLQTDIEKVKKTPTDAAAVADLKKKIDAAIAAATTPDDKNAAGTYAIQTGALSNDNTYQRKGVTLLIESGKSAPEQLPRLHFYAGNFAFEAKEYDLARKELEAAFAGGLKDPDAYVVMAQVFLQQKQDKDGLPYLVKAIDTMTASGKEAPDSWYRSAMGTAYGVQDYATALSVGVKLIKAYPTTKNWSLVIVVIRDLGKLPSQDSLDLLRLQARTKSFTDERDYGEFVQSADARRNPGEVKAVIEAGVAAGVVDASKTFFAENLKLATSRIAPDRASLPALEKDARLPNATGVRLAGAGDAFLSYGEGAKAADLYKLALDKPGIDKPTVLTRLGIAQVDSGDFAGAQASFAAVEGPRKGIATLWGAYAAQKASGK